MSRNLVKNLGQILLIILLSTTFAIVGFIGFNTIKTVRVSTSADTSTTPSLKVQKITLTDAYATNTEYDPTTILHDTTDESIMDITNEGFVMLNTATNTVNTGSGDIYTREAIYIEFGDVQGIANVTIKFNGLPISKHLPQDWEKINFRQYIHLLTPTQIENGGTTLHPSFLTKYDITGISYDNTVANPEGKYEIDIEWYNSETTSTTKTLFSFYATTQTTYSSLNENTTWDNTENFALINNDTFATQRYFHFNNVYTSKESEVGYIYGDYLEYPVVNYNPEKYNLSYKRVCSNYVENVTLDFVASFINGAEVGVLTVISSSDRGPQYNNTYYIEKYQGKYCVRLQLTQVGVYSFNKVARLKVMEPSSIANAQYITPSSDVVTSNPDLLKGDLLTINGYQANYALPNNKKAVLYNDTYYSETTITPYVIDVAEFGQQNTATSISATSSGIASTIYAADFSFALEESDISTNLPMNSTNATQLKTLIDNNTTTTQIASTNQAPIMFDDFFGKLNVSFSWYLYIDSLGNQTIANYKFGMEFENAGQYYMYITYANSSFENLSNPNTSKYYQYMHQIFAFQISSSSPVATVYAQNNELSPTLLNTDNYTLNKDAFTNKYVYLEWQLAGPFDDNIMASYEVIGWDNVVKKPLTNYDGLIYKTVATNNYMVSESVMMLCGDLQNGMDGKYNVRLFYQNSPQVYVNYAFNIDTSAITGIQALEANVAQNKISLDSQGNTSVLSSLTNYSLTTNKAFAWTWNKKESGASISALYTYCSLTSESDFLVNSSNIMTQANGAVWMLANGNFGTFQPTVDYTAVENFNQELLSGQLISNAQLAILLLSDEAGNTQMFITVLDNTTPVVLQTPAQSTYINIITQDTTFTWGTHKALNINTMSNPTPDTINDISDLINNNFEWKINNQTFQLDRLSSGINLSNTITTQIQNYNSASYLVVGLEQVSLDGEANSDYLTPQVVGTVAQDYYAVIKVDIASTTNENSTTQVFNSNYTGDVNVLQNGVYPYTITISDVIHNSSNKYVEVNLDQSQGRMYSYSNFTPELANELGITDIRQAVSQTYSTNRRFVTFSWTEPSEHFNIEYIKLNFYPMATDNKSSANYPYSETAKEFVLYSVSEEYPALNTIISEYGTYLQTNMLANSPLVITFNDSASQSGKYVIERKYYDADFNSSEHQNGDSLTHTYTYYVDRNSILPTLTDEYGKDISLSFGYNAGSEWYSGYPNYGKVNFNKFDRSTNNDTFVSSLTLDPLRYTNIAPVNSTIIDSNILPASVNLYSTIYNNYTISDKYLSSTDTEALTQYILENYSNSSRLQVVVQYFTIATTGSVVFNEQTFYSTKVSTFVSNEELDGKNYSLPLTRLNEAFRNVGRYRVILMDLANLQGPLTGNVVSDFGHFLQNSTFVPNYSIINFALTGTPPSISYQAGDTNYTSVDPTVNITNSNKVRIVWSDPADAYTAQIAFNNISITQTLYTKAGPGQTTTNNYSKAILLSTDQAEVDALNEAADGEIVAEYVASESMINSMVNGTTRGSAVSDILFYKTHMDTNPNLFNYYLLLPQSPIENNLYTDTKLSDVKYIANVHYIGRQSDYVNTYTNDTSNFQSTKSIYVDNTAPYKNLQNLIYNDALINSLNTPNTTDFADYLFDNLDNTDFTFFKSYAFAVPVGFTLQSFADDPYDAYINYYYTKRTTYTGVAEEQTKISSFSPGDTSRFTVAKYKSSILNGTALTELGYYDIIEQDQAGNIRVYTIFVTNSETTLNAQNDNANIYLIQKTAEGTSINLDTTALYSNSTQEDISINETNIFSITDITNTDKWLYFNIQNLMSNDGIQKIYYAPIDLLGQLPLVQRNNSIKIFTNKASLLSYINNFISEYTINGQLANGSKINLCLVDRVNTNNNLNFNINTAGINLVTEDAFFNSIITVNNDNTFTVTLPYYTLSTRINSFKVYINGSILQVADTNSKTIPSIASQTIGGDSFVFPYSNIIYQFRFIDNFNREVVYSFPTDESLIKELSYTGGTIAHSYNGKNYTYTSSDVKFKYQSASLRIAINIIDLDTNTVLCNYVGNNLPSFPELYSYSTDSLSTSITNITFLANAINKHYKYKISVDNYTDSATIFEWIIYTYLPIVSLTDASGSPLLNQVTSKSVLIQWNPLTNVLFNPYVELVSPLGTATTITSPTLATQEGGYQVRIYNSLGLYLYGTQLFTIRSYDVTVYGVYQKNNDGTTTQLFARTQPFIYTIGGVDVAMEHYVFLSSDSNWDNNIEVICNADKGLTDGDEPLISLGENIRIYRIFGFTTHYIDTYFAITRIPRDTISKYTGFKVNASAVTGDYTLIATKTADETKANAVLDWTPTYIDTSYGTQPFSYSNFYILDLYLNDVLVGSYTSGNIILTQAGIYRVKIYDIVGQTQRFNTATEFKITLLTDIIYTVNGANPIQNAIFNDKVDLYVPETFLSSSSKSYSYDSGSLRVTIYRNNELITIIPSSGHYNFTLPGVYRVNISGKIIGIIGTNANELQGNYQFTIMLANEAIATYEFTPITSYTITKIIKNDEDITSTVRGTASKIYNFTVTPEDYGVGIYTLTINVAASGYSPSQNFTFSFRINNEIPSINCSRDWGSASTAPFTLTLNLASIYQRVGNCQLVVNNEIVVEINEETGSNIVPQNFSFGKDGVYVVQLLSASGNLISSNRITITIPLNTAAIVLIVLACVVVVGVVITFILMRNRMKVR